MTFISDAFSKAHVMNIPPHCVDDLFLPVALSIYWNRYGGGKEEHKHFVDAYD